MVFKTGKKRLHKVSLLILTVSRYYKVKGFLNVVTFPRSWFSPTDSLRSFRLSF